MRLVPPCVCMCVFMYAQTSTLASHCYLSAHPTGEILHLYITWQVIPCLHISSSLPPFTHSLPPTIFSSLNISPLHYLSPIPVPPPHPLPPLTPLPVSSPPHPRHLYSARPAWRFSHRKPSFDVWRGEPVRYKWTPPTAGAH